MPIEDFCADMSTVDTQRMNEELKKKLGASLMDHRDVVKQKNKLAKIERKIRIKKKKVEEAKDELEEARTDPDRREELEELKQDLQAANEDMDELVEEKTEVESGIQDTITENFED